MCSIVTAVVIVYGMGAVEVGPSGDPVRIAIPECAGVVRGVEHAGRLVNRGHHRRSIKDHLQGVRVLTQTV